MNELLKYCIKEIEYIKEEEVFTVRDLFLGYKWNRLSLGERRNIGYVFRNYIYLNKDLNVVIVERKENKKDRYIKYKKVKKNAK